MSVEDLPASLNEIVEEHSCRSSVTAHLAWVRTDASFGMGPVLLLEQLRLRRRRDQGMREVELRLLDLVVQVMIERLLDIHLAGFRRDRNGAVHQDGEVLEPRTISFIRS